MRTLQLSELAAYLPYQMHILRDGKIVELCGIEKPYKTNEDYYLRGETKQINGTYRQTLSFRVYEKDLPNFKPILRPMSDFDKLGNDFDLSTDFEGAYYTGNSNEVAFINTSDKTYLSDILTVNEYLFSNHFDVFGLIEAGLAIDINSLNNGAQEGV